MPSPTPEADALDTAVMQARGNREALAALEGLYSDVDAELAAIGQACRACGICCHFDRYGHRLYVTTLELAFLVSRGPALPTAATVGRCPYQRDSACTARAYRSLGCRVFSCLPANQTAERDLYDSFHRRIRDLHRRFGLPYYYVDLTESLQ